MATQHSCPWGTATLLRSHLSPGKRVMAHDRRGCQPPAVQVRPEQVAWGFPWEDSSGSSVTPTHKPSECAWPLHPLD